MWKVRVATQHRRRRVVRRSLEHFGLAPESGIEPTLDVTALTDLAGNEWLR